MINPDDLAPCAACGADVEETTERDEDGEFWHVATCACGAESMTPERMTWRYLAEEEPRIRVLLLELGVRL